MRDRGQETIGIRWEVHPCEFRFKTENCAYEGRVLVGEPVVLLASPGGGLNVIDGTAGLAPRCFGSLAKLLRDGDGDGGDLPS